MSVAIRNIQHYLYCKRRFGLLENNCDWAENALVVKANIMHSKVHSGEHSIKTEALKAVSDIWIYNDELDIYGKADCIEFIKSKDGISVEGFRGLYKIAVVEYKPTRPKNGEISESDAIQVFAQKLCVDSMWNCDSEAYIYYADVKKRVRLPFDTEYNYYFDVLKEILKGIEELYESGEIPYKEKNQKCSGCSMADICLPVKKKTMSLREDIFKTMDREVEE